MSKPDFIPLGEIAEWANRERVPALAALARMVEKAVMGEPFEDVGGYLEPSTTSQAIAESDAKVPAGGDYAA